MSYLSTTVASPTYVTHEAVDTAAPSPPTSWNEPVKTMDSYLVPLSQRVSSELWARAWELRRMAGTARTADLKASLETLANRFSDLAAKREAEEQSMLFASHRSTKEDQPRARDPRRRPPD